MSLKPSTEVLYHESTSTGLAQPSVPPIYQTATFTQSNAVGFDEYDYSRSGNPTRTVLEKQLARIEGASHGFAFSSGMAAISNTLRLVGNGESVLATTDLYGGTSRFLEKILRPQGNDVQYADSSQLESFSCQIKAQRPRLVFLETPSNPLIKISDIAGIADACKSVGAILAVDNTMMSPCLQRPLEHGASIVIHSATKFLSVHADVTAGSVCTNDDALAEKIKFFQNAEGTALAPFDSWLLLRGMKTIFLRVKESQANAEKIAAHLLSLGLPTFYPLLDTNHGARIHGRQASGGGSVMSFRAGSFQKAVAFAEATKVFRISVSFGSISSTLSVPVRMSHASIPDHLKESRPLPDDLVRLSVGIEHNDDLLQDLQQALKVMYGHGNLEPNQSSWAGPENVESSL